jgi:uncharacterized protein (DUF1800 family)
MAKPTPLMEHLLRRAGFGMTPAERERWSQYPYSLAVLTLTSFNPEKTDIDQYIGTPGYVGITTSGGAFRPDTSINDARQRWLFRMVHSPAPLQEKMALFWHHHFATAQSKIVASTGSAANATRTMAAKPQTDAAGAKGQIELFREMALSKFRDLLVAVAKDVAMLFWLDGYLNTRARPQENFGRELMELFTFGVGNYTEADVYAAARVFTGWNLTIVDRGLPTQRQSFFYNANNHDNTANKTFSFPIYPDGSKVIRSTGQQEGVDLINACVAHPNTGRYLARKLYGFFVNDVSAPDEAFIDRIAEQYYSSGYEMKPVVRFILTSPEFSDQANYFARYSWPVEYVVRLIKEMGWIGYSVNNALTPLANMGQQLLEPPDVAGWALGKDWFSTGMSLERMNYASLLATNQRVNLRDSAMPYNQTPDRILEYMLDRLRPSEIEGGVYNDLLDYARAGAAWTGSQTQVQAKSAGLAHLIGASGQYQFC